jgi:hypothetical protein
MAMQISLIYLSTYKMQQPVHPLQRPGGADDRGAARRWQISKSHHSLGVVIHTPMAL